MSKDSEAKTMRLSGQNLKRGKPFLDLSFGNWPILIYVVLTGMS